MDLIMTSKARVALACLLGMGGSWTHKSQIKSSLKWERNSLNGALRRLLKLGCAEVNGEYWRITPAGVVEHHLQSMPLSEPASKAYGDEHWRE